MSTIYLMPGQIAVKKGEMKIHLEKTSFKFYPNGDGDDMIMNLQISFTPNQVNPKSATQRVEIDENVGDCGVFTIDEEHFDQGIPSTIDFSLLIGTGEQISIESSTIAIMSNAIKGEHGNTLLKTLIKQVADIQKKLSEIDVRVNL